MKMINCTNVNLDCLQFHIKILNVSTLNYQQVSPIPDFSGWEENVTAQDLMVMAMCNYLGLYFALENSSFCK